MIRDDYAFPFRIDGGSRQAQRTNYPAHVRQMIRQVLLTAPGERVNLPEFGCGLRQLVFAPRNESLDATAKLLVQRALDRWLSNHIRLHNVNVASGTDEAELHIQIDYVLLETQGVESLLLEVK